MPLTNKTGREVNNSATGAYCIAVLIRTKGAMPEIAYRICATDGGLAKHSGRNFRGQVGSHQDRNPHFRVHLVNDSMQSYFMRFLEKM